VAENGGFLGSNEVGGHFEELTVEIGPGEMLRATYTPRSGHLYAGSILEEGSPVRKPPPNPRPLMVLELGAPA
jgi:hypothetical protein